MVVNDCYILQSRAGEDSYTEHWIATAIFSATRFLLRFIKNNSNTEVLELLRKDAVRCYHVSGPAIADFVEVDLYKGSLFIASEYHDEKPLFTIISKNNSWRIEQICMFMTVLARAVHTFHSQNVFYGSLNEETILTGISGIRETSLKIQKPSMISLLPTLTKNDKNYFNTYAYIAPEYKTNQTLCEGSDVYSLGVLLVKFITGKLPFPESEKDIFTNSASLRFVANALFRRGICEDLVRIALNALLSDPKQRYSSCIDMIAEIRYFMQKMQMIQPDVYDYSNTRSETDKNKNSALFPLVPQNNPDAIEQLEKQELIPTEAENNWSVDDYINNGIRTVQKESSNEFFVKSADLEQLQNFQIDDSLFELKRSPQKKQSPSQKDIPKEISTKNPLITPVILTEEIPSRDTVKESPRKQKVKKPKDKKQEENYYAVATTNQMISSSATEGYEPNWNYSRIQFQDVWGVLEYSIKRAKKGIGCFRYIQEPTQYNLSVRLFHLLETLKDFCLFVNLGTYARHGQADTNMFLTMLRHGLTRELSKESQKSLSYLARQVKKEDSLGAFSSPPLGSLLYGKNNKEIQKEFLHRAEYQTSIIRSLFAFSRKKKPLVLVMRGGESIQQDLNYFLNSISSLILDVPVCIFVFFDHTTFPPWHTLSLIQKK